LQDNRLKPCSYFLLRYAPNPLREDGLNVGILLHCPEEKYLGCIVTSRFSRIKRFDPRADRELFRFLQKDFEEQIEQHENDQEGYLQGLSESMSNAIRLEGPRAVLLAKPEVEIEGLFVRSVGHEFARTPPRDTRVGIKQRLTAALVHTGVWEHLEKRIAAERWTQPGDPFTFDYGYKPDGIVKLIHAVSLRDTQLAKTLVYTLNAVRRREPAELTAVTEDPSEKQEAVSVASRNILREGRISLQPLAGIENFAKSIRQELRV
jgi:hypothetical protein